MVYDAENTFMWKTDISGNKDGDIVANSGGGAAYDGLFLYAKVNAALDADATVTLTTSDDSPMSSPETVCTLTVKKEAGSLAAVKLPHNIKKYLKAAVSGASTGTLTTGLAYDVDVR